MKSFTYNDLELKAKLLISESVKIASDFFYPFEVLVLFNLETQKFEVLIKTERKFSPFLKNYESEIKQRLAKFCSEENIPLGQVLIVTD